MVRRRLEAAKLEQIRQSFVGNEGRMLKCDEYSDLCSVIQYVFGEGDRIERRGGGLESHPKLHRPNTVPQTMKKT